MLAVKGKLGSVARACKANHRMVCFDCGFDYWFVHKNDAFHERDLHSFDHPTHRMGLFIQIDNNLYRIAGVIHREDNKIEVVKL